MLCRRYFVCGRKLPGYNLALVVLVALRFGDYHLVNLMWRVADCWNRWRGARAVGYVLPYHPLPLVRRVFSAWVDFVPVSLIVFFYLWGGSVDSFESDFLVDVSMLFVFWTLPRVLGALFFRRSVGQMLLRGEIRSCADGSRVTVLRAGLRNILGILDYVPGVTLVNIVMVLVRRDRRTLYDLVVGTVMVDVERPAPRDWASQVEHRGFGA